MYRTKFLNLLIVFLIIGTAMATAQKIHAIGDSTMANYDEEATVTRGWAMYLQQFLRGVEVNNRGKGGASSKSFYREPAYWESVKRQLAGGDYVSIQFAHNDEKNGGADGDSIISYYKKAGDEADVAKTDYRGTDVKWGYVFRGCTITAPGIPSETDVWLGRPWHNFPKTVFIDTRAEVTIPAAGWYETMGGLPVLWADYNTMDDQGNPLDLSHRRDTYYYVDANGEKVCGKAKNYLTDAEAAAYTVKNVLGAMMVGSRSW